MSHEQNDFSPEIVSHNYKRRTFIHQSAAYASGIASGLILIPISEKVNTATTQVTKHRAGNPSAWQQIEHCQKEPLAKECLPHEISTRDKVIETMYVDVVAPYIEERIFRDIPAKKFFNEDTSSGKRGLTRREITVGVGTSVAFGLTHNAIVLDTQTIPASQTVSGFGFWYLRRKFGFASNFLAHATLNTTISRLTGKFR